MTRFDPKTTLLIVALENELLREMAAGGPLFIPVLAR